MLFFLNKVDFCLLPLESLPNKFTVVYYDKLTGIGANIQQFKLMFRIQIVNEKYYKNAENEIH